MFANLLHSVGRRRISTTPLINEGSKYTDTSDGRFADTNPSASLDFDFLKDLAKDGLADLAGKLNPAVGLSSITTRKQV